MMSPPYSPWLLSLFLPAILGALPAQAKNSSIAFAWHQWQSGKYCSQVPTSEAIEAKGLCHSASPKGQIHEGQVKLLPVLSYEIFDWSTFQAAAESQITKNQCIVEQLNALITDDEYLTNWQWFLAAAWMGVKKTQSILEICHKKYHSKIPQHPVAQNRTFKQDALESLRVDEEDKVWREWCMDQKKFNDLKSLRDLLMVSVPVISSPEFFELAEKYRNYFIHNPPAGPSTQEGKPQPNPLEEVAGPVTDKQILSENLSQLGSTKKPPFFYLAKSREDFLNETRNIFKEIIKERSDFTEAIQKAKRTPHQDGNSKYYELDDELKQKLFDDGSVTDFLMTNSFISFGVDEKGNVTEVRSNGASCLLAKYEPTLGGEVAETLLLSTGIGGMVFKLIPKVARFSGLTTSQRLTASAGLGYSASYLPTLAKTIAEACVQNRNLKNGLSEAESAQDRLKTLTEGSAKGMFDTYSGRAPWFKVVNQNGKIENKKLSPKEYTKAFPTCSRIANLNTISQSLETMSCERSLLETLLLWGPLTMELGVMACDYYECL